MRIGIDIMGGDYAPKATTLGAILASRELPPDIKLVLIGDEAQILPLLKENGADPADFEIVHTTEVIGMGEHPTRAVSQKPKSTISLGFQMLREGKIDAFCSAGNTGAMLVGAMYTIKSVPGIIRPVITSILPRGNKIGILLDVGANADCKPDVLYQFAIVGSLYAQYVYGIENPKIGLLNIGEEPEKGNLTTQAAHQMMKDTKDFNFIGNVEGRDLFRDTADVIVCEGFVGNVVLKSAEGFFYMVKKRGIKDEYFDQFNYERYGGTPILGVNGAVVVGHGISNEVAIKNMIKLCKDVAEAKLSDKIKEFFK